MKLRPYVSVDIETTGLDEKSHVIEIGAVLEDFKSPVSELKKIRIPVKWETFSHAEPYALMLNAKLIEDICKKNIESYTAGAAVEKFVTFLEEVQPTVAKWDEENGTEKWLKGKIQFGGKNFAGFDGPMLNSLIGSVSKFWLDRYIKTKMHRVIDAGSVYFDEFGYVPSLPEINKKLDRNDVTHCAVDDAIDVIVAIRKKLGVEC